MSKCVKSIAILLTALVGGTACQVKKSSNPLSPSVAGPIPGVSITTPRPASPAAGARIVSEQQPVTLTIENAATSGVRPISYLFEVASDAAFTTIVASKEGVAPDPTGKTSFRLPAALPDKTYFWRARAQDGANTGSFAAPVAFTIYTPVVLAAPQLASPAADETISTLTPRMAWANVARSGPAGPIVYLLALYADSFQQQSLIGTWQVPEVAGTTQTMFDLPPGRLAPGRQYFWFVAAAEPTTEGPHSRTGTFRTQAASPTTPPTGGGGGGGSATDFAGLGSVTVVGGSPDVSGFAVTSRITSLRFSPGNIHLEHTKTGQWPGVDIGGALQEATLWVFFRINGQWYGTGAERWRPGQTDKALSAPSAIGPGWFYNNTWAPMTNYVPRPGEQVGFMVVAGSTRVDSRTPVRERSAILMIPFPADGVTASFP